MGKSWKLHFWQIFKVQNFEFLVNFFNFFHTNVNFIRKISKFCYPRSFMIFSSTILWNFGEKNSELPSKLKILQTIFQNPTYITFFRIFLKKWNNIVSCTSFFQKFFTESETRFGFSEKFLKEWDTWRLYYFNFQQKFQKMWYM